MCLLEIKITMHIESIDPLCFANNRTYILMKRCMIICFANFSEFLQLWIKKKKLIERLYSVSLLSIFLMIILMEYISIFYILCTL